MDGNQQPLALHATFLDLEDDTSPIQDSTTKTIVTAFRVGIRDALVVAASSVILLGAMMPLPIEILAGGLTIATAPLLFAIGIAGLAQVKVQYVIVGVATCALLVAAYLLTPMANSKVTDPLSAWHYLIFLLPLSVPFAAVWSSRLIPSNEHGKPALPCAAIGQVSVLVLSALAGLSVANIFFSDMAVQPSILVAMFIAALLPPTLATFMQARREHRLPVKRGDKQPDHISGLGATTLILFVVVVVTLGLWAAATGANATISVYAGVIVLIGLVAAFGIVAFGLPSSRRLSAAYGILKLLVKPIGWLFSTIDSLFVFVIANALGANEGKWPQRFILLLGSLTPCAVLGWWLPPPYGLIPLAAAILGTLAIARRWSWVEEDRENAMLARRFEGDHIRVGFTQDLKDEALIGFAALFLIIPITLRQLHFSLGGEVFTAPNAAELNSLPAWLSFFGTELAKAVPFVDWTEIYQVRGSSPIHLDETTVGVGQHVVFGMRILVDLVLLAAFLQAIAITQRTRRLKDMFYDEQSLNRLDPFIEDHELGKLVQSSTSGFVLVEDKFERFPVYDPDRLEELKQRNDQTSIAFVAAKLLERDEAGGPEERLSRETRRETPDKDKCIDLLAEVSDTPLVQVGPLKAAHFALNDRANYKDVRKVIVQQLVRAFPIDARISALSEILIGPFAGVQDARQEVRAIALQALFHPALQGDRVAQASISRAATHDPAAAIRTAALEMVEQGSTW